jgi:hypothetical protein
MVKECIKCNKYFNSNGECVCIDCKINNYDLYSSKRDHAKNVKSWNAMAAKSQAKIEAKYGVKHIKRVERYIDSNLGIKYEIK